MDKILQNETLINFCYVFKKRSCFWLFWLTGQVVPKLYHFCLSITHFSCSLQETGKLISYTSWAYILIKQWMFQRFLLQHSENKKMYVNIKFGLFYPLKAVNGKTLFSQLYRDFSDNQNCLYQAMCITLMH